MMKNFSILVALGVMCLATPGQANLYVRSNRTSTLPEFFSLKNPIGRASSNPAVGQINNVWNLALNSTQDAVNGLFVTAGMAVSVIQSPSMTYFTKYVGPATYIRYKTSGITNSMGGWPCTLTTGVYSANVDTMRTTTTDGYTASYGTAYKDYTGTDPDELNLSALTAGTITSLSSGTGKLALARRATHTVGMGSVLDLVNMCVYNYTCGASSSITPAAGYDSNC